MIFVCGLDLLNLVVFGNRYFLSFIDDLNLVLIILSTNAPSCEARLGDKDHFLLFVIIIWLLVVC